MAAEPLRKYTDDQVTDTRSVSGKFVGEDSLGAQAHRRTWKNTDAKNDPRYEPEHKPGYGYAEPANEPEYGAYETARRNLARVRRQALAARRLRKGGVSALKVARLGGTGSLLYIAGVASFFQSIFGLLSLAGLGMQALIEDALGTGIGAAVATVLGVFGNIQDIIPFQYIGLAFWGIATTIALGAFVGFFIYFYLMSISIFRSTVSLLITAGCFALALLPITNIIPTLFLWVLYMFLSDAKNQVASLYSTEGI